MHPSLPNFICTFPTSPRKILSRLSTVLLLGLILFVGAWQFQILAADINHLCSRYMRTDTTRPQRPTTTITRLDIETGRLVQLIANLENISDPASSPFDQLTINSGANISQLVARGEDSRSVYGDSLGPFIAAMIFFRRSPLTLMDNNWLTFGQLPIDFLLGIRLQERELPALNWKQQTIEAIRIAKPGRGLWTDGKRPHVQIFAKRDSAPITFWANEKPHIFSAIDILVQQFHLLTINLYDHSQGRLESQTIQQTEDIDWNKLPTAKRVISGKLVGISTPIDPDKGSPSGEESALRYAIKQKNGQIVIVKEISFKNSLFDLITKVLALGLQLPTTIKINNENGRLHSFLIGDNSLRDNKDADWLTLDFSAENGTSIHVQGLDIETGLVYLQTSEGQFYNGYVDFKQLHILTWLISGRTHFKLKGSKY